MIIIFLSLSSTVSAHWTDTISLRLLLLLRFQRIFHIFSFCINYNLSLHSTWIRCGQASEKLHTHTHTPRPLYMATYYLVFEKPNRFKCQPIKSNKNVFINLIIIYQLANGNRVLHLKNTAQIVIIFLLIGEDGGGVDNNFLQLDFWGDLLWFNDIDWHWHINNNVIISTQKTHTQSNFAAFHFFLRALLKLQELSHFYLSFLYSFSLFFTKFYFISSQLY